MVLEVLSLTCAHPKAKNLGISVIYSQRYYPGQRDVAFTEKATSILNSIEFPGCAFSLSVRRIESGEQYERKEKPGRLR
jgi:hypothetical protein